MKPPNFTSVYWSGILLMSEPVMKTPSLSLTLMYRQRMKEQYIKTIASLAVTSMAVATIAVT